MYFELEGKDCNVVVNALRVAAETFAKDAATCKGAGDLRTAEHFEMQRDEARALADRIDEEA